MSRHRRRGKSRYPQAAQEQLPFGEWVKRAPQRSVTRAELASVMDLLFRTGALQPPTPSPRCAICGTAAGVELVGEGVDASPLCPEHKALVLDQLDLEMEGREPVGVLADEDPEGPSPILPGDVPLGDPEE